MSSNTSTGAAGGTGSANAIHHNGGAGGTAIRSNPGSGAGGGGAGGTTVVGGSGNSTNGGTGGGLGGAGGISSGGAGGKGGAEPDTNGGQGTVPGGGGASSGPTAGAGNGANGKIILTYTSSVVPLVAAVVGAPLTDPVDAIALAAGIYLGNQGSAPGTPTAGVALYGASGHEKYKSTDANAYNTGRLSVTIAGPSVINAVAFTTVLSVPVVAGTYRFRSGVGLSTTAVAGAAQFRVTGPAASLTQTEFVIFQNGTTPAVTTQTAFSVTVGGPVFNNGGGKADIEGTITFTASGTLAIQAAASGGATDPFTIEGAFLDLMPVT